MSNNKKEFKAGTYAVTVGAAVAVVLILLTVFAFKTRYTAFSPEKVAQSYVDTIVQSGDGYNAYKNTILSQNKEIKYGDFIRNAYMRPYVNDSKEAQDTQADFVGTGSKEEQEAIDTVYDAMYRFYVDLMEMYSWDNYDELLDNYFAKLVEVRHEVYEDDYMDMDYMFGALEANVIAYGESLTGVEEQIAADGKTVLREAQTGKYQEMFGENYQLTTTVTECTDLTNTEIAVYATDFSERIAPLAESGETKADLFGITDVDKKHSYKTAMVEAFQNLDCSAYIDSAAKAVAEVTDQNGRVVAVQELYVIKIGNCWYVDNTNIDTSALYLAQ